MTRAQLEHSRKETCWRRAVGNRVLWAVAIALVAGGGVAWHYQSQLIGIGARWYLERVAASEDHSGDLTRRREMVARVHRQLLLMPAPDVLVAELYDFVTQLSARVASGEISLPWSFYLYTTYLQDLRRDRPGGEPRATRAEIEEVLDRGVEFFHIKQRPDAEGARVRQLWTDDSITLEEIEQAHREGRDLTVED